VTLCRIRVVRCHRPDSWTRAFIGEVLYVDAGPPTTQPAGVFNAPYVPEPIAGYDVRMDLLTPDQHMKLWRMTGGLVVGDLFAPAESVEWLGPV